MNKNNKITTIGYTLSLLSFIGAFFFFTSGIKNYGDMFLVTGGILLTGTSIYKILINKTKKLN